MDTSYESNYKKSVHEVYHYIGMKRYQKAMDILMSLLEEKPNDADLLYLRAYCLHKTDCYQEALECCNEALSHGFSIDEGNYLLGKIYMEMNRYVQAEQCFLEALRLNPQAAKVMAIYGYLMLLTGNEKKAERLFDEALRLEPDNEVVLHYRFHYYLAKGKHSEQVQTLGQFIDSSDNEVSKFVKAGLHDLFQKNYKSSRENFRQAFLLEPTNKSILGILEEVDRKSHFLYFPHRVIERMGGPAMLWVSAVVLIGLLRLLNQEEIAGITALVYISIAVYTWITPGIYKLFFKPR